MSYPGQLHIRNIPDEHLAEIFRLAIGDARYRGKTRTIIQLVCRSWRRTMLNSKFLWSKITVEIEDLSMWNDPGYGWPGEPHPSELDLRYIAQCLRVAHGHPLDITLRIADFPRNCFKDEWDSIDSINTALRLLRSHSIRVRSLFCSAPSWFFNKKAIHFDSLFNLDYLPRLETLSLFVEPDENIQPAHILPLVSDKVGLSQTLRHLSLNFPFHHFDVAWCKITSFTGGFDDHSHFFDVLPRMVALESLHLTYIQPFGAAVPEQCITLEALRHLKLSDCAAVAMSLMADKLRLPGVQELSLSMSERHLHRLTEDCRVERVNRAETADSLCCMLERAGATIGTLNFMDPSIHALFFGRLCEKLGCTVQSLQLEFKWPIRERDITNIFGTLTVPVNNFGSLLPKMIELAVIGTNLNPIFEGPALEGLVESRWDEDRRDLSLPRLQKLRLRRIRHLDNCDAPSGDSLADSSLAMTLWKYRSAGLDVQWMDEYLYEAYHDYIPGDVDVLNDTQKYIPQ